MIARAKTTYVVDSRGRRKAVIMPVKEYERILRELEDLRDAQYVDEAEATADGYVSLSELKMSIQEKQ